MAQLTTEMARAAERRGLKFTREMPVVEGFFDDGDDAAKVVILGVGAQPETVLTAVPGTDRTFEVRCDCVTINARVAEHLEIALSYLHKYEWMQRNPRAGRRAHVCNPALH